MPLSKALYHTCFFCGQRCKCWSRRPQLTSSVISDVKPIIYILHLHFYIYLPPPWSGQCKIACESINQSINQISIAPIFPAKPCSVARQPNQCSTAKSRKQFRNINRPWGVTVSMGERPSNPYDNSTDASNDTVSRAVRSCHVAGPLQCRQNTTEVLYDKALYWLRAYVQQAQ